MEKLVLLVDDDDDDLAFFGMIAHQMQEDIRCSYLEPMKCRPEEISILKPDLILIETQLGCVDSFECVRTIKRSHGALPVVFYTNILSDKIRQRAALAGAAQCMLKPTDLVGFRAIFCQMLLLLADK